MNIKELSNIAAAQILADIAADLKPTLDRYSVSPACVPSASNPASVARAAALVEAAIVSALRSADVSKPALAAAAAGDPPKPTKKK